MERVITKYTNKSEFHLSFGDNGNFRITAYVKGKDIKACSEICSYRGIAKCDLLGETFVAISDYHTGCGEQLINVTHKEGLRIFLDYVAV